MNLLDTYKKKHKDDSWVKRIKSTSKKAFGTVYAYTNTNFRTQNTFITSLDYFLQIEGVARSKWEKTDSQENDKEGQEKHKHYVDNYLSSKLFRRTYEMIICKTEKGKVYKQFVDTQDSDVARSWFINYLFLLNGHWGNQPNHIIQKTIELKLMLDRLGIGKKIIEQVKNALEEEAANGAPNKDSYCRDDWFYFFTFYGDEEFVRQYLDSSDQEKKGLQDHIILNLRENNKQCCVSQKMCQGGSYSRTTLFDEIKVFMMTYSLLKESSSTYDSTVSNLLRYYASIFGGSEDKIKEFIGKHEEIFEVVVSEALQYTEVSDISDDAGEEPEPKGPEDFIDDTVVKNKKKVNYKFQRNKKHALESSDYRCSLEDINNCKYFTSKLTKKNYLEVHHIIPQSFRNHFKHSIDVLANYATLCPHCHNCLHKAVDEERETLLKYLFDKRESALKEKGIDISQAEFLEYYGIDKEENSEY